VLIPGLNLTVGNVANYASVLLSSMSEAWLLLLWGGALIFIARSVRFSEPREQADDTKTDLSNVPANSNVRLQPGV
jgi:hypothetical protein